jgi:hypothetical protein
MANRFRRWLPLCAAPLLSSCYFILDYGDLTSDRDKPLAAGGSDGVGGETAAGGSACGDCDDQDPCTTDSCGSDGECKNAPTEGLVLDGVDQTLEAKQHVRVSLVGSGQYFYLAELENDGTTPAVGLYRLATDGDALEAVGGDLGLDGTPLSNVGIAIEELAAGEVALHGFLAIKPKLAAAAPRVVHVVTRAGKTMSNVVSLTATYRSDIPTVFPQALTIAGKVVGAWIQADGTVAVHNIGTARTDTFGSATLPATTLSLLSTSDDKPAVMYTAQSDAGALGTYVETSGQNRAKVAECETKPGSYLSSSVISSQIPGLWLANITRAGTGYLTTGSASLVCTNNTCTAVPEDCAQATPSNAVREIAGATIHFDNDAAGVVYSVVALPQVAPGADPDSVVGRLSVGLGRVDFSGELKDAKNMPIGDLKPIAENATSEAQGFLGPDWPAVAILPSQRVAVAWIQPNQDFSGSELRVQRYKMCLPPP